MAHEPMHAYRVDQATRLRELMRQKSRRAITLAITSGKGGVGKSNVAVNLSICLASRGLRVTLVDVDMGLANADVLMNISPRFTLAHVLAGTHDMEEICVDGHGGVRFAAGASGRNDLADISEFERHNLLKQFQKLHRSADIVVLDCGAGISKNVIGFAQSSDRVMVVTTPQPTAMADAYATIKVLHREGYSGRVGMLTNMANSRSDAEAAYRRISGVAKRFLRLSVADDGYMLHDTAVELAVRDRCPFVIRFPGSNASACIAAVSARMVPGASRHRDRGGFFKRVAGLFV